MISGLKILIRIFAALGMMPAAAIPMKVETLRTDLKRKTLYFAKREFDQCGANLVRLSQTLTYSCSLKISSKAKESKLRKVISPKILEVPFGGTHRDVQVEVSPDARQVTFMTSFDATGIDFEISKFNDDFFSVYDKVAQLVIGEAMRSKSVKIEVLETR